MFLAWNESSRNAISEVGFEQWWTGNAFREAHAMIEAPNPEAAPKLFVVIGIPTYRRPKGLARLLDSVAKQQVDFDVSVLVADNDAVQQEGMKVVERYRQQGFKFAIDAFVVAERGISQVRNALMQRAFVDRQADLLAMLDDDEWAEEDWLGALVRVQTLTQADVVGGHVSAEFEVPAPDWLQDLDGYHPEIQKPRQSGFVPLIYGTTNVLLSKSILTRFPGQFFDPFYALVGRGDTEFFTRLRKYGAVFAFAHHARSHELFGASRLTKRWARERAFCDGAGHMRIVLRDRPGFTGLAKELSTIVLASMVAIVRVVVNVNRSHRRMAGQMLLMRQLGKISALFGKHRQVYRQLHGQ